MKQGMNLSMLSALLAAACVATPTAKGQSPGGAYLRSALTASFRYEESSHFGVPNAPGYGISYSYRPRRWLAVDAGLDQIIHPAGGSMRDELYLIPFGARYVASLRGGRVSLSVGGGGAYLKYTQVDPFGEFSAWSGQAVGSASYGLTRSGSFALGVTGRDYYTQIRNHWAEFLTLGPDFSFSF